jgi:outer membrane protein assembly factor BamE (lipoprotein component of BamABCDE complex)
MERPARSVNAMLPTRLPGRAGLLALTLALALPVGACGLIDAPPVLRGHRVTEEKLKELVPGVQGRADVQALLGSPTARSTFDDSNWYYISATSRARPMTKDVMSNHLVVVVEFDDAGRLKGVRELTAADQRPVAMVQRETPVPGNERSLLQALFGNVGRFNPLGGTGAALQASNPGATQPTGGGTRIN